MSICFFSIAYRVRNEIINYRNYIFGWQGLISIFNVSYVCWRRVNNVLVDLRFLFDVNVNDLFVDDFSVETSVRHPCYRHFDRLDILSIKKWSFTSIERLALNSKTVSDAGSVTILKNMKIINLWFCDSTNKCRHSDCLKILKTIKLKLNLQIIWNLSKNVSESSKF